MEGIHRHRTAVLVVGFSSFWSDKRGLMYCYALKPEGQILIILMLNWPNLHLNYILDFSPALLAQCLSHLRLFLCIYKPSALVPQG